MNEERRIKEFINAVKENYDSIIALNLLKENEKNLENLNFKFYLFSIRDSSQIFFKVPLFSHTTPEFNFFNEIKNLSIELSSCAEKCIQNELQIEEFYQKMEEYCQYAQEWQIKFSLYLK